MSAEVILARSKPVWFTGSQYGSESRDTSTLKGEDVKKKMIIEKFVKGKIELSHLHSYLSQPGDHPSGEIWTREDTNKEIGQANKSKTRILSKSLHIKAQEPCQHPPFAHSKREHPGFYLLVGDWKILPRRNWPHAPEESPLAIDIGGPQWESMLAIPPHQGFLIKHYWHFGPDNSLLGEQE